jgi:hypothetical protein
MVTECRDAGSWFYGPWMLECPEMAVTIQLPPDVEERLRAAIPNLDGELTEVSAIELFRRGQLSHFELSKVLGLDRFETDAYLKRHNIFDGSPTFDELEADRRTLDGVLGPVGT